jgi:hypothetical protein
MAIVNGYTDLATVKARLGIADTDDDATLESIVTAVSRSIDDFCRRRFYAATETRYYTAPCQSRPSDAAEVTVAGGYVDVDDLLSISANGLATDDAADRTYGTVWATTDYELAPYNAALDGKPYTRVCATPNGARAFPSGARGVKITGSFGYSATTPDVVREACLLQASRIFRRKDAPFGVTGSAEMGVATLIARLDPDVMLLLNPLRRLEAA